MQWITPQGCISTFQIQQQLTRTRTLRRCMPLTGALFVLSAMKVMSSCPTFFPSHWNWITRAISQRSRQWVRSCILRFTSPCCMSCLSHAASMHGSRMQLQQMFRGQNLVVFGAFLGSVGPYSNVATLLSREVLTVCHVNTEIVLAYRESGGGCDGILVSVSVGWWQ